jgi:2-polyprenyl-3-methyl-5-hydroxy-6-metoxy-1,4-benzoquinol methylase
MVSVGRKQAMIGRQAHWENVYATKDEHAVSWFQEKADISLDLIRATGVKAAAPIIDIGGGASRLVDTLLDDGFKAVIVLDFSEKALEKSKARLGARGADVQWVTADITTWEPSQTYDVWHDRAALHFLTDPKDRAAYAERVSKAVRPGGHVIIGTFAPDGPERCSGLPVVRYDAATLGKLLGRSFELIETRRHEHKTPAGVTQRFQFSRFQRTQ